MIRLIASTVLVATFAAAASARGDSPPSAAVVTASPPRPEQDRPKPVQLGIQPAAAPQPAFKYRLLPGYLDQSPGNAALIYHLAIEMYKPDPSDLIDRIDQWLGEPVASLPREEVRAVVDRFHAVFKQLHTAARREKCDWDHPIRTEGFEAVLPSLSHYRSLAKLVALKARFEIGLGKFDQAAETLQTGYAMARHVSEAPILINHLVGIAIAKRMNDQVLAWIEAPGAPNLYWALSALPVPFDSLQQSVEVEGTMIFLAVPALTRLSETMSTAEMQKVTADLNKVLRMAGAGQQGDSWESRFATAALAVKLYPGAKKRLAELGRAPQEIEAMPAQQVVLLAALEDFTRDRDDMLKWIGTPYWLARPKLIDAEKQLQDNQSNLRGFPFTMLLPSLRRAYYQTVQLDRQLAALKCIEAIRMHLAGSGGEWPASLDRATSVPLPEDPMTGREFVYKLEGPRAVLIAPAPPDEPMRDETHYILTINKP